MIGTALLLTILAQDPTPAPDQVTQIREEVADLKVSVGELKSRLQFFEQEVAKRTAAGEVELDPAKSGEVRYVSSKGVLFAVAFDAAVAEGSGMRVRLHVAPLNSFIVAQMDVAVTYGKSKDAPEQDRKTYNTSNIRILHPDRWNSLDLVLPGAVPSDFGFLSVSLTPQSIRPPQR